MATQDDMKELSRLNARFIENFISQDAVSHDRLLHPDFVCIENSGEIVARAPYLRDWATAYTVSGCTSFRFEDEYIRLFGHVALVRSKTTYTKNVDGKTITGSSVYTDTYVKEDGQWRCVQAQITPVIQ